VNAVLVPLVVSVPSVSSRYIATEAIIARAESFTLEGDCPSAQLTFESAVELDEAVVDQLATPVAIFIVS
jgi:hypothetical protein